MLEALSRLRNSSKHICLLIGAVSACVLVKLDCPVCADYAFWSSIAGASLIAAEDIAAKLKGLKVGPPTP